MTKRTRSHTKQRETRFLMNKDKIFQEVQKAIQSEKDYFEGCKEYEIICNLLDRIQQKTWVALFANERETQVND